jgi:hypothetical protein
LRLLKNVAFELRREKNRKNPGCTAQRSLPERTMGTLASLL